MGYEVLKDCIPSHETMFYREQMFIMLDSKTQIRQSQFFLNTLKLEVHVIDVLIAQLLIFTFTGGVFSQCGVNSECAFYVLMCATIMLQTHA